MKKAKKSKTKKVSLYQNRTKRVLAFLFAAVFGIVGIVALYRSFADSPGSLVFAEEFVKPLVISKEGDSVKRNYQDIGFQILSDGTLICGDESDPDYVYITTLRPNEKQKVIDELEQSGIANEDDELAVEDDETLLGDNITGITYRKNGQLKFLIAPADKAKNGTVQKIHNIGKNTCKKADHKVSRQDAPIPNDQIEINENNLLTVNRGSTSSLRRITGWLRQQAMPKASAATGVATAAEGKQYAYVDNARHSRGIPLMARNACLQRVGRTWSYFMSFYNTLDHIPDLQGTINRNCTTSWRMIGENVGYRPCNQETESSASCSIKIFDAFMASPGHAENILRRSYNNYGVGGYRDTRKLWITQEFMQL